MAMEPMPLQRFNLQWYWGQNCVRATRWARLMKAAAVVVISLCISMRSIAASAPTSSLLQVVLAEHHGFMFCYQCTDPLREGSSLPLLSSFSSPRGYFTASDLVYGVPNKGEAPLFNEHEARGRIVLLDRGKVSFARKVRHAQMAGASGVIIVDKPSCSDRTSRCFDAQSYSPRIATVEGDGSVSGFSTSMEIKSRDSPTAWIGIQIPSVLISASDGERLKSLMTLSTFEFKNELQYTTEL